LINVKPESVWATILEPSAAYRFLSRKTPLVFGVRS
jgi:hypothetical protein